MAATVTQAQALGAAPLVEGERAEFFAARRFDGFECLTATFRTHAYPLHSHDTYAIGIVERGCESFMARGSRHYAAPGDVLFNNPLVVHDGTPHAGGYAYRMIYPAVAFIQLVAGSVSGQIVTATPEFKPVVERDDAGARLFAEAHAALQEGVDGLAGEELMLRALGRMLILHGEIAPTPLGREHGPVARVRQAIEARFAEDLRLDELARVAGLSTHHLIRAFRSEIGLTPHAYVIDVRTRRARDLLRHGLAPADTAAAVGFADQAHLTRAFKARFGVTPGVYRRAVAPG